MLDCLTQGIKVFWLFPSFFSSSEVFCFWTFKLFLNSFPNDLERSAKLFDTYYKMKQAIPEFLWTDILRIKNFNLVIKFQEEGIDHFIENLGISRF